jgi:LysM repeat protein
MSSDRKAVIALGVIVVVMVGAIVGLVTLGGDDEGSNGASPPSSLEETAPTRAAPTTTGPPTRYQVQPGDTLTSIAQEHGVSPDAIIAANELANPDALTEGQTLLIPSAPPVQLVITPATANPGRTVQLELSGAQPSETITFEVISPSASFTGTPHTASDEGRVATTYTLNSGDPAGTYTIVATGDQGTVAEASLQVEAAGSARASAEPSTAA